MKKCLVLSCVLLVSCLCRAIAAPVHLVDEPPVEIKSIGKDTILVDFGKVSFGNIRIIPLTDIGKLLPVRFGEALKNGRIDRKPPGTVRYATAEVTGGGGVVAPSPDERNTQTSRPNTPPAILTPPEWGVVLPFRWVEIDGWPGELKPEQIVRQSAFSETWDDDAAEFDSSDELLNRIWDLCHYSIKATTFAGVYVDGDRERIPYEADAYLNQLSHYTTDNDIQMARDTYDHLMKHPTWPTEWAFHMIFMAHADYLHTGDTAWLAGRYEALKPKLLLERLRDDGLLTSDKLQMGKTDIVDWPQKERDGYVFRPVNTVVNAFFIRSLAMMADMAKALGKTADAAQYTAMEAKARRSFQEILFDGGKGIYRDGEGTNHASQHASLFPLAFGLVPADLREIVAEKVAARGMACSVYAAQYLMEGLFENGRSREAIELITAPGDRSWKHMVNSGTTITWEAWDLKYKPNQDWNHAWGAAPANLFPRYILGVRPLVPGWKRAIICPNPCDLESVEGKVPTPLGPVRVGLKNKGTAVSIQLPDGMSARVEIPAAVGSKGVFEGDQAVPAKREGSRWILANDVTGTHNYEVR